MQKRDCISNATTAQNYSGRAGVNIRKRKDIFVLLYVIPYLGKRNFHTKNNLHIKGLGRKGNLNRFIIRITVKDTPKELRILRREDMREKATQRVYIRLKNGKISRKSINFVVLFAGNKKNSQKTTSNHYLSAEQTIYQTFSRCAGIVIVASGKSSMRIQSY